MDSIWVSQHIPPNFQGPLHWNANNNGFRKPKALLFVSGVPPNPVASHAVVGSSTSKKGGVYTQEI